MDPIDRSGPNVAGRAVSARARPKRVASSSEAADSSWLMVPTSEPDRSRVPAVTPCYARWAGGSTLSSLLRIFVWDGGGQARDRQEAGFEAVATRLMPQPWKVSNPNDVFNLIL